MIPVEVSSDKMDVGVTTNTHSHVIFRFERSKFKGIGRFQVKTGNRLYISVD